MLVGILIIKKQLIGKKEEELNNLLDKYRSKNNEYDCVVPPQEEDSAYVAHELKTKYGMNPTYCYMVSARVYRYWI